MTQKKTPIEEYYPIEKVNQLAEKEGVGFLKQKFRPHLYTHLWFARRLGCVFRSIILYTLAERELSISKKKRTISGEKILNNNFTSDSPQIEKVEWEESEDLWKYYKYDVNFSNKKILDPFMGGGTTTSEAIRFNAKVVGCDLNPVAWFMAKKQLEPVDPNLISEYKEKLKENIAPDIKKYYKTECRECGEESEIIYTFWSKIASCVNCKVEIPLMKSWKLENSFGDKNNYVLKCKECGYIFESEDYSKNVTCPNCGSIFNARNGPASRTSHICENCGQKEKTIESVRRRKEPLREKMVALKYHCENCEETKFKAPEDNDKNLYQKAGDKLEKVIDNLPIPEEEIPEGYNTRQAKNYNYNHFEQMFNSRQKLCLGMLLKSIKNIGRKDIRELFLLSFSKSLESNNMFCGYDSSEGNIGHLYARHDYAPKKSPVENNVWGHRKGVRTFSKNLNSLKEAMEFSFNPVERYLENGQHKKTHMETPIRANVTQNPKELDEADALLMCGDSSYLPIKDNSIDAIITDPPYGDNVMYSELSDFFYVWLKEALRGEYDYFEPNTVPKGTEVIENKARGKTSEDFAEGLTSVLEESYKKLKDEGVLVFTFHHSETKTWNSVLKSVLDSGFFIKAVYPVKSEVNQSMLIRDKGNIEYDMIIVCRKRDDESEEGIWSEMEDKIYLEAKEEVKKLRTKERELTRGDMFVITIGKCLEIYSKHYPTVKKDGENISVKEALEFIQEIVDGQLIGGQFDELVEATDAYTATFLTYLAGKGEEVSYSSLNKNLQQRSIDISDLVNSGVVKQIGSSVVVPEIEERAKNIKKKSKDDLTAIDRAHYLIYLKKEDKLASKMRRWYSKEAITTLKKLADIENNEDYKDLAEFIQKKTKNKTLR